MMENKLLSRRNRKYSQNPFIQTIFTADPSAHVWEDGRLYVYPSHDIDPARGCDLMDQYHVFSTSDMVNWRDEGEILRSSDIEWGRPSGGFMWAPDCAYYNGKYYFYFPHPSEEKWNDSWKIGVAISDKPTSGFKSCGFIEGVGGHAMIDPAVFIDDDNQAYLYYGGGKKARGVKLSDDMVTTIGEEQEMQGLHDFHEATWVFKRDGIYYLTYSDNHHGNNNLCYATSDHPLGPWNYQGTYLEPTGCETSHGSVVEYRGQWYAFYHSDDLSHAGTLRSICWDPIEFTEDGLMKVVVQTRNGHPALETNGLEKNGDLTIYGINKASEFKGAEKVEQADAYEKTCLKNFSKENNSVVVFDEIDGFKTGKVNLGIYYATPDKLAKCILLVNGEYVSLLNMVFSGSWRTFDGYANFTLLMEPGKNNRIELIASSGNVSLEAISVEDYSF